VLLLLLSQLQKISTKKEMPLLNRLLLRLDLGVALLRLGLLGVLPEDEQEGEDHLDLPLPYLLMPLPKRLCLPAQWWTWTTRLIQVCITSQFVSQDLDDSRFKFHRQVPAPKAYVGSTKLYVSGNTSNKKPFVSADASETPSAPSARRPPGDAPPPPTRRIPPVSQTAPEVAADEPPTAAALPTRRPPPPSRAIPRAAPIPGDASPSPSPSAAPRRAESVGGARRAPPPPRRSDGTSSIRRPPPRAGDASSASTSIADQIAALEAQLQKAISSKEFEKCSAIQSQIDALKAQQVGSSLDKAAVEVALEKLEEQMQAAITQSKFELCIGIRDKQDVSVSFVLFLSF